MSRRPAIPLAAANLAAVAALAGAEPVVALLVALWVADFALRLAGLRSVSA